MHIGSSCFISCNRNNLLFGIYTLRGVIINYNFWLRWNRAIDESGRISSAGRHAPAGGEEGEGTGGGSSGGRRAARR